jgi:diguanylate cyclase (GGDEF)-like protein
VAAVIAVLYANGFLARLELAGLDLLFRLKTNTPLQTRIVVIEIDDDNIYKIGRWPWDRNWHAAITKALKDLGAKYIYFDIVFSEKSSESNDNLFVQAIKYSNNVYLPYAFRSAVPEKQFLIAPIETITANIKGTGFINVRPDLDGVLRRLPLFMEGKDNFYFNINLRMVMDILDMKIISLSSQALVLANAQRKITIPLVDRNKMLINWQGKWKDTFTHYSFLDILTAYQDILDKKTPALDITPIKDSICFVAVTAMGLYDIKPIPLEAEYPSAGALAVGLSNILENKFIYTAPVWAKILLIFLIALIPAMLISEESPFREILSTIGGLIVFAIIYFIFNKKSLWLDFSVPLLALFGSYIAVGTYSFARISVERRKLFELSVTDELTGLYNIRYFKNVLENECSKDKIENIQPFCLAMIDIDHFKGFNDTYGHMAGDKVLKETAAALKSPLRYSDVIARYGGEEIIVLMRGNNLKYGLLVAERLRKSVETMLIKDKANEYKVTVSIGVACFRSADNINSLIQRADEGLYRAKESGRNCVKTAEIE